jgi:methylase of polypeptide subunit release factors
VTVRRSEPRPWEAGPLGLENQDAATQLSEVLRAAGYDEKAVAEALGVEFSWSLSQHTLPVYRRRLAERSLFHTLIELFTLGTWVDADAAAQALAPADIDRLAGLGLLERGKSGVHARVGIAENRGLFLVHDDPGAAGGELPPDYVLGLNPSSLTLAQMTVRPEVRSALDVGTGGGFQAFLAARHSGRVLGTDTNVRGLNLAAFNAQLNGLDNLDFREGSWFEPVGEERFDLIVCNPPYVISPETRYLFRDSGLPRDTLSAQLLRETPGHLEEGGFACMLASWGQVAGEDWSGPPTQWLEGTGCDAVILRADTKDVLTYASAWISPADPKFEQTLQQWLTYYRDSEIEAITVATALLRRRSGGTNWVFTDELPQGVADPVTPHLLRIFESRTLLSETEAEQNLLGERLRMSPQHRLEQYLAYEEGRYAVKSMQLRLTEGLPLWGSVDDISLHLLSRCDGTRTLREAIADLAGKVDVKPEELTPPALALVTKLMGLGFLERVG